MVRPWIAVGAWIALVVATARPAAGTLPEPTAVLEELGFSARQIHQVHAGSIVQARIEPSSERELVVAFAFRVKLTPAELVEQMRSGVLDRMVLNASVHPLIENPPTLASFAQLALGPDAQARAQAYTNAKPGRTLNLSHAEIARFDALRSGSPSALLQEVQNALLTRLQEYRVRGLAGIAPYARSDRKLLFPGDELRIAALAAKQSQALSPAALQHLLAYPADMAPGTREDFRWSEVRLHDLPTLTMTHRLAIPDGEGWVVAQRQFYVSTGYNCEQSIARYLPMRDGTLVIYTNRASTDEVLGFGGGVKRDIGNRVLAWRLEDLYGRYQARLQ
jgi:hypothetical protein